MSSKLIFPVIILIFVNILTAARISFVVIPDTIPKGSDIYIAGNQPQLAEWESDRIRLTMDSLNRWTGDFEFESGTVLEFKFTRGSWMTEAVDEKGMEYANFSHFVQNDTTLLFKIPGWRDLQRGIVRITQTRFDNKTGQIELTDDWKFHSGDDSTWSAPDFDDRGWQWRNPQIYPENEWIGIGWFRLHLYVDSLLLNRPLGFYMRQIGASEIFLNGEKIKTLGTVADEASRESALINRNPMSIVFNKPDQFLAVRHSNFTALKYEYLKIAKGFQIVLLEDLESYINNRAEEVRRTSIFQMIFTILPLTLALLHLLLFIFSPKSRQNLFYSLCMIGFAGLAFSDFNYPFTTSISEIIFFNQMTFSCMNFAIIFGLLTAYYNVQNKVPVYFYYLLSLPIILIIWTFIYPVPFINLLFYLFMFIAIIELIRTVIRGGVRQNWAMTSGLAILIIAVIYQILMDYEILPVIMNNRVVYVYGILALSFAISINLAREFSTMHTTILDQEREEREREIERRLLEADNARKTKELEEARNLQLSMLPSKIPQTENLKIAVFMQTASEVGGDYYDFFLDEDGTLTIAIGDATGHGIKAGIMVTLIKNIFNTVGQTFYLPDFLNHCTKMIKKMRLGNLYMAMQIVRIRKYKMTVTSAGMPPIYIYRQKLKNIEEIIIKAMPLGGPSGAKYIQTSTDLAPGDKILLMSDGYGELFNPDNETLDLENIKLYFLQCIERSPKQIIEYLMQKGMQWSHNRPQGDDITFIVIQVI